MRFTTRQAWIEGQPGRALSTADFNSMILPRRQPPSAVMTSFAWQSLMRSFTASGEKPPKITVWIAPTRAQASIAIMASGIIGR